MSSLLDDTARFHTYVALSSFALLYYDYLLTLNREVSRYWGTRTTPATFFFYLNRYGSLFGTLPVVFEFLWTSESTSEAKVSLDAVPLHRSISDGLQVKYHQLFVAVSQLVFPAILIMRTYALYDLCWRVLTVLTSIMLVVFAFGIWTIAAIKRILSDPGALFPRVGCGVQTSTEEARRFAYAWSGILVLDILIVTLTVWKALFIFCEPSSTFTRSTSVPQRHGPRHSADIISFLHASLYLRGVATFQTNVFSSITISRFMLNLRDPTIITPTSGTTEHRTTMYTKGVLFTTVNSYYQPVLSFDENEITRNDLPLQSLPRLMSSV
ncbi:hypothetical protein B0H17DRAFT_1204395 [Mycena rosella]|uniref:DUF6533 domain-containing protein n=1 Tax=Mycena rosella TaxID=1033263 RepID=A0AAD7D974_MYCRO|nr:hypothetical protein B0H17DRAFT_1204395 [Mycena rosella]